GAWTEVYTKGHATSLPFLLEHFQFVELFLRQRIGQAKSDEIGGPVLSPMWQHLLIDFQWQILAQTLKTGRRRELPIRSSGVHGYEILRHGVWTLVHTTRGRLRHCSCKDAARGLKSTLRFLYFLNTT